MRERVGNSKMASEAAQGQREIKSPCLEKKVIIVYEPEGKRLVFRSCFVPEYDAKFETDTNS